MALSTPTPTLTTSHGRVAAVRRLTPNLLEVTLTGFGHLPLAGGDEFVYAMVSEAAGGIDTSYGMDEHRRQDPEDPVRGAYYTVRRFRPAADELDIWVVDHRTPGSVGAWMAAGATGRPVALWGPRIGYTPPAGAEHLLLVADETGFAAVAVLLERLPVTCRATAVLECCGPAHRPPLPAHPRLEVVWVDRGAAPPGVDNRLLAAVAARFGAEGRSRPDAAFGAGESRHVTAIRRHVVDVLQAPAHRTLMTGYWRRETT